MSEIKTNLKELVEGELYMPGADEVVITEHHTISDILRHCVKCSGDEIDEIKYLIDEMGEQIIMIPGKIINFKGDKTRRETMYDGTEHYTEGATRDHINAALDNPNNKSVEIFYPGSIVKKDGKSFGVNRNGNLIRHPADRKRSRNNE